MNQLFFKKKLQLLSANKFFEEGFLFFFVSNFSFFKPQEFHDSEAVEHAYFDGFIFCHFI